MIWKDYILLKKHYGLFSVNDASRCNDKNCTGQSERVYTYIKGLRRIYGLITRYLSDFFFL